MILIIGSYAYKEICTALEPKDLDLIMEWKDYLAFCQLFDVAFMPRSSNRFVGKLNNQYVEITIAWEGDLNDQLLSHNGLAYPPSDLLLQNPIIEELNNHLDIRVAPLDWLYTLKMSHRFRKNSPHFAKTMSHIHDMRHRGAKIINLDWYKQRVKETLNKHPNLNQDKKDFFNTPGIIYKYDHDSIHRAIALYDKPAYQYYIDPKKEVWCDRELFAQCSREIKIAGVLEESLVLALERSQIPNDFNLDKDKSFKYALEKVCTSITSGWFRTWAWEHYYEILNAYNNLPFDYTKKFKQQLDKGIVLPFEEQNVNMGNTPTMY